MPTYAYICDFIGSGEAMDDFRPAVSAKSDNWGIIDLRGDVTKKAGKCLAWTDGDRPVRGKGIRRLDKDLKAKMKGEIGVDFGSDRLEDMIAELLLEGVKGKNHLCNELHKSTLDGQKRIYFGNRQIFGPKLGKVKGGTITDDFNRATLGSNWTVVVGTWNIRLSDEVRRDNGPGIPRASIRYDGEELTSSDHYAQITVTQWDANGLMGPCVRFQPAANTFYAAWIGSVSNRRVEKVSAGTATQLSNSTATFSLPHIVKLNVIGDGLEFFYDGVSISSVTDTTITTGTRVGIMAHPAAGGSDSRGDDFEASELGLASSTRMDRLDRLDGRLNRF
jgi:hypothetical protein